MHIVIGSHNPSKIKAVTQTFLEAKVTPFAASSDVSAQPFSDEETRFGAINRAIQAASCHPGAFGIGLEGGVMELAGSLYLCNWGAFVTADGALFTASGARILLPRDIAQALEAGAELGDVMAAYVQKEDVRHHEGAIGIFTAEAVSRAEMFAHVVTLLKGQWTYNKRNR